METYCVQRWSDERWFNLMETTEWPIAEKYCHDYEWNGEVLTLIERPWDRVIVKETQEILMEKNPEGYSVLYRKELWSE